MARGRNASSKPQAKTQADVLEAARDTVVRLRNEGLSLNEITEKLAGLGVRVNRNAVDRFCKKHGIPAGKPALPDVVKYESFSDPVSVVTTEPPAPAQPPEESALPQMPVVGVPVPDEIPPAWGLTSASTVVHLDAGAPLAPPIYYVSLPIPYQPQIEARSLPDVTDDQLATAKILAGLGPRIERIDAAHRAGDYEGTALALREATEWLRETGEGAPAYVRELAIKAIREAEAVLESGRKPAALAAAVESNAALFTPMPPSMAWTPDVALVSFGAGTETDRWTIQDACEGTLILGSTGSGKTSGSGATIARAFLLTGFGGIVLTVKQDESSLWDRYAISTGRTGQVCAVRPGGPFRFNFLEYQASLPLDQGGSTENLVESIYVILEGFVRGGAAQSGGDNGSFWANTTRQLLRNLVRVLRASKTAITFAAMRRFLSEAPQSLDDAGSGAWQHTRDFGSSIASCQRVVGLSRSAQEELDEAVRYWLSEFPGLNPKTRSIVVTAFTSMIDLFFDPTLSELFLGDTTITPEAVARDGAIIVVDLPVEKYQTIGRLAQLVWKHFLQQAVKRRTDTPGPSQRPVFLWVDEFQCFLSDNDAAFQATARSARCATVFLTQNLPGVYAQAGPTLPRERVDALAGNLATKFFHANSDPTTNQWAADQVGKSMQYRATVSSGEESRALNSRSFIARLVSPAQSRTSTSPTIDYEVQPSAFTRLRTGAERWGFTVDAVMVKSGARFSNGKHYLPVSFRQERFAP